MAKNGFQSFIGLGKESSFGSQVAPTNFIEFNSESIMKEINRIMSAGIRNSASASRYKNGAVSVGGDIEAELPYSGLELLLLVTFGKVTTSNVDGNVYQHIFEPVNNISDSLSIEVNRGGIPFRYAGCKVNEFSISSELDAIPIATFGILGQEEYIDTDISPAAASEPTYPDNELSVFVEGVFKIDTVEAEVMSFEVTNANNLKDDKRRLGKASRIKIPRNDLREVTGTMHVEFDDLTHYQKFVNGTEASLELKFTGSLIEATYNREILIELPRVIYNGETPQVGGREIIENDIPFTAIYDVENSKPELKITLQNEVVSV